MRMGEKIKILRKNKGLTLEAMAKAVGSSKGYIWEIENKKNIKPSVYLIKKIAVQLGVTVDYLLTQEIEESKESLKKKAKVINILKKIEKFIGENCSYA